MNEYEQQEFVEAIALAREGHKDLAYVKLLALSKATGAKDPQLLLWVAFTTPDLNEALTAIRMAETIIPNSPTITQAYAWLRAERAKSPVSTVPPPPFAPATPTPAAAANPAPKPENASAPPEQPPPAPFEGVVEPEPVLARFNVLAKLKDNKRLIYTVVGALVGIAIITAAFFLILLPIIRGPEYTEYTSVARMIQQAAPRDLVKFQGRLTYSPSLSTEDYDYYAWYLGSENWTVGASTVPTTTKPGQIVAVYVRFPRTGDLRPSVRQTYYYTKVLQQGYQGQSVLVDAQKVDYSDKVDLIPAYPLIQGKAIKTIRAQELPGMGVAPLGAGYVWISTNIEIYVPKDDPNIKISDVISDMRRSVFHLVSPDPRFTSDYGIEQLTTGNMRSEGVYNIIPATISMQGPVDWQSLEWVATLGQREIRVPLKL